MCIISDSDFIIPCSTNPTSIAALIGSLRAHVSQLETQVHELKSEVQELRNWLSKDSHNSSKPRSSDGLRGPPKLRSLRPQTNGSSGAQLNYQERRLDPVEEHDRTEIHSLDTYTCCGHFRDQPIGVDRRPVRLFVTEHRAFRYLCPHCQTINQP